jgi:hypothetical protein
MIEVGAMLRQNPIVGNDVYFHEGKTPSRESAVMRSSSWVMIGFLQRPPQRQ